MLERLLNLLPSHRRRAAWRAAATPPQWRGILMATVPFYARLSESQRERLELLLRVFMGEKKFIGANRLKLGEPEKLIIAAHACRLLIGRPDLGEFPNLREVIVYPQRIDEDVEVVAPDGRRFWARSDVVGRASKRGPVLLDWRHVQLMLAGRTRGSNVIVHEFAHVLDFEDGMINGTPRLQTSQDLQRWHDICERHMTTLTRALDSGLTTFLDPYAATNTAEFFAVATEAFFEQSHGLQRHHGELYDLFKSFYNQDPIGG